MLKANTTMEQTKENFEIVLGNNQIRLQNRNKIKAYCANLQAKMNTVVEGQNPTYILGFPNEIWEQVFSHLDDLADVQNCFNTCVQFRSSLSPSQKTLLHLKKVLPILFRLRYLNMESMFNLRLVSKDFRKFINAHLQSKKSWVYFNIPKIAYFLLPNIYNSVNFRLRMKLGQKAKFRALIRKVIFYDIKSKSPFLSRFLIIYKETSDRGTAFFCIIDFLEEWGNQIWYLELFFGCTKSEFLQILRLLPNLKYLRLCGTIREDDGENLQVNYSEALREAGSKLTSLVISRPKTDIAPVYDNLYEAFPVQLETYQ